MHRTRSCRAALGVVATFALAAAGARAGEPAVVPDYASPPPPSPSAPAPGGYGPYGGPSGEFPYGRAADAHPRAPADRLRPVPTWFRTLRPCECWANPTRLGCGSVRSDLKFIFGGCRSFFGEPCLDGPPPGYQGPPYPRGGARWTP